jgi:hypothetical protein
MTRTENQIKFGFPMNFKKNYFVFQEGIKRLEAAMSGMPDRVPVFA